MAMITRSGFSANTEVEASSFSVWNCVITFLQILLVSTILYGAGWNQGQMYNITPENLIRFHHFRAIAFFFCVWALQSVSLALFLVWAIGKRSYQLCHSWMLCEALMQMFIILSTVFFVYRTILESDPTSTQTSISSLPQPNEDELFVSTSPSSTLNQSHETFSPPRHIALLLILHFLIKGFGFWIVRRYMKLLKTTNVQTISHCEAGSATVAAPINCTNTSPPPSYAYLCNDDLPCYDEALKLCFKDSTTNTDDSSSSSSSSRNNSDHSQDGSKSAGVNENELAAGSTAK